jgi:hypothetical protein
VFDHWQQMVGNVYEAGGKLNTIIKEIRARKALSADIPLASHYIDKL